MYVAFAHTFSPYYTLHNYVPCVMVFAKTIAKRDILRKMRQKLYMPQTRRDCMVCDNWCFVNAGITHIAFNAANTTKMSTFQKFLFCILHSALCVVRKNRQWTKWSNAWCMYSYFIKSGHCALCIYILNKCIELYSLFRFAVFSSYFLTFAMFRCVKILVTQKYLVFDEINDLFA